MTNDTYDYLVQAGLSDDAIDRLAQDGIHHLSDLRGRTLFDSPPIGQPNVARSRMLPEDLRKQKVRDVLIKPLTA